MRSGAAAIFVAGVGFVGLIAAGGAQYGLIELVVLTFIVALAVLGLRMIFQSRGVEPAVCPSCGGLVSPNAPFCKHCKAPL